MSKNVANIKKTEVPVKAEAQGFFKEMEERMQELEKHFESLFRHDWMMPAHLEFPEWTRRGILEMKTPKVDIIERDDDIILEVGAVGICDSDLHMLDVPPKHPAKPGVILGHEFSGRVTNVGKSVRPVKPSTISMFNLRVLLPLHLPPIKNIF